MSVQYQTSSRGYVGETHQLQIFESRVSESDRIAHANVRFERADSAGKCLQNLVVTDRFFRDVFATSLPMNACIYDPEPWNNSLWWDEKKVACFGEVDSALYKPFHMNLTCVAHEFGHAFNAQEPNKKLGGAISVERDALEESLADVWAVLVDQYYKACSAEERGQKKRASFSPAEDDWEIGRGVFASAAYESMSLRSLRAPGKAYTNVLLAGGGSLSDEQAWSESSIREAIKTLRSKNIHFLKRRERAVRIEAGLPSHAFYLAASNILGPPWEKVGRIWREAFLNLPQRVDCGFQSFATQTALAARKLYGENEEDCVRRAWGSCEVTTS